MGTADWSLVIPVKPLAAAKSRLRGAVPAVRHERLVLALVLDTIVAARECAEVYLVTDDPAVAREAAALGARVLPDDPRAGLNAALRYGAAQIPPGYWVGALSADLPALRPAELRSALQAVRTRSFVADAAGTGTTLLAAPPGDQLDPRFGPGSAGAHTASGARPLAGDWPSLRRDVDTAADLTAAARLGLGPRTLVEYVGAMQGTVASYDADTRSGTMLLDDGTEVAFPSTAFDASGLRLLRLGQRLRIERDGSGAVVKVTLPTFHDALTDPGS